MPKLWTDTIEAHRREVRDAVLDTTAALVTDGGLLSVTMSRIAEETGIGRATLYKYFPDVDAILLAWHERQVAEHIAHLIEVRDRATGASERLEAVLTAYAQLRHQEHGHHGTEAAANLHRGTHTAHAEHELHQLIQSLLTDAVASGAVRDDTPVNELTTFCLSAAGSAGALPSKAAVRRVLAITLDGIRPPASPAPD